MHNTIQIIIAVILVFHPEAESDGMNIYQLPYTNNAEILLLIDFYAQVEFFSNKTNYCHGLANIIYIYIYIDNNCINN